MTIFLYENNTEMKGMSTIYHQPSYLINFCFFLKSVGR